MTEIDYDQLNEQATKIYDSAFRAGHITGVGDRTTELANITARSHLDIIQRMLRSALDLEDAEGARLLAVHARTLAGRTPIVHDNVRYISTNLADAQLNDSSRPFLRGRVEACHRAAQTALEDLGGYR